MKLRYMAVALGVLVLAGPSWAGWTVVDDFESYTITGDTSQDTINGKGYWVVGGTMSVTPSLNDANTFYVGIDPTDASNQVLKVEEDMTGAMSAKCFDPVLAVAQSDTPYTIFGRLRVANDGNTDFCMAFTDSNYTTSSQTFIHGRMRGYALLKQSNNDDPNLDMGTLMGAFPRGAGGYYDVGDATKDNWYSFWIVIHNVVNVDSNGILGLPNDSYEVYVQGGEFTSQTYLGEANFRAFGGNPENGVGCNSLSPLQAVAVLASKSMATNYFDDLYIDTTGQNLSNPIPEPASIALIVAGGVALAIRRRRRPS